VIHANKLAALLTRSPFLWGGLAAVGFYTLLDSGQLAVIVGQDAGEYFRRYFAGHWINYSEGVMFFIGLAALVLKLVDVLGQTAAVGEPLLDRPPAQGQTADDCDGLLAQLDRAPARLQDSYLVARLRAGLEHVRRRGSAEALDDELRYLAEADAAKAHGSYALVRIIIWAIPILGFLGTVVGITLAIANLAPQALEQSLSTVTAGLGVAFDTTAVALTLSIILMFGQFLCDKLEGRLLERVEARAAGELTGRFQHTGTGGDPQVAAVRRMTDAVLQSTERIVQRQAEIWQASIEASQQQWSQTAAVTQQQFETALTTALTRSLQAHAGQLASSAQQSAEENQRHWSGVQQALVQTAEAMAAQQRELARQGEVLRQVVETTAQVIKLEEALNRNLAALGGSQNFEETVQSLAAVIHLLNARLGQAPTNAPALTRTARSTGQAA
jgi:biopolymer transport protein ExbB/TolQ